MSGDAPDASRDYYRAFVDSERYRRERPRKARVIAALCGEELRASGVIADLGTGTGLVKKALETELGKELYGFDIDRSFMRTAERMVVGDVLRLPLPDASVDFAILNHLYEHVEDQPGLFEELHRVVAPGGAAYVSAGSRWAVMEPHYRLAFLSWLPRPLADRYLRWTGRGTAYRGIRFRSHGALRRMMRSAGFDVEDRTAPALDRLLEEVRSERWAAAWRGFRRLPDTLVEAALRRASPQWFFVLHRPEPGGGGTDG